MRLQRRYDLGEYAKMRKRMVDEQLMARGICDKRVLDAFLSIPREHFLTSPAPPEDAYGDFPLPILGGQTISQPYMVAYMLQEAQIGPSDTILEIGAGSGYQTALLSRLAHKVYAVEIDEQLYRHAKACLQGLGITNVELKNSDGKQGWSEAAPFDKIIVSAAAREVPKALISQLKTGGRLLIPVADGESDALIRLKKTPEGIISEELCRCYFVPLR